MKRAVSKRCLTSEPRLCPSCRIWVWGLGFLDHGLGFRAYSLVFRVWGLGFLDHGLGFRAYTLGFRVWGLGFLDHGLGFRAWFGI